MRLFQVVILFLLMTLPLAAAMADDTVPTAAITAATINAANLSTVPAEPPSAAG